MKKEMLFLLSFACICFCSAIKTTAEIPAGNGKDPAIKKEPLKARISLSDDNIERLIANDPRPIYLTVETFQQEAEVGPTLASAPQRSTGPKPASAVTLTPTPRARMRPWRRFWTEADQSGNGGIGALKLRLFLSKPTIGKGPNKKWEDYNKEWEDYNELSRRIHELENNANVTISTSSPKQEVGPQQSTGPTPASAVKLTPTPRPEPTPRAIMRPWRSRR